MNFKSISSPVITLLLLLSSTALFSVSCHAKVDTKAINFSEEQSLTTTEIIQRLSRRHYLDQPLNDDLSSRMFDAYLARLDGNRSFFLQSDINDFEQYRFLLDNTLSKGDLAPGYAIFNRYQQRLVSRLSDLIEQLPAMIEDMNFDRNESLIIDRSEQPWPQDKATADDLWRKIVKSRVLSLRLAKKTDDEIIPLLQKRYTNQLNRIQQSNAEDAFQVYINSMTELYDPHTNYLSPSTSENFNINMSLSLQGIGAVLQLEDEYTKVVRLIHAGPADKQGQLQPSDRIVAVAQHEGEFTDIIGMRLDEVVQLIRGPKDSRVKLQIIPVSAKTDDEIRTIEIVRDTVKLEEQSAKKKILDIYHDEKLSRIGIIDIPAFYIDFDAMRKGDPNYRSTTRDVKALMNELIAENVDGIIIDLRENGGGSLQEANQLTGLFIEQGATVQIRHSSTKVNRQGKRIKGPYYSGPMAVLINRLSASASEIFAGAIQDYQRGVIVGTQSFGKGTVQSLSPLSQGQLKVTESKFYRISGESTQHRGVIPDIAFPELYDKEKVGESSLDNALAWDQIRAIPYKRYFNIPAILPQLRTKHQLRMKEDPDFIFLEDQLSLMESSRAIKSIPLNQQARATMQKDEKEKALFIDNKRRIAKGLEPRESQPESDDEHKEEAETVDKTKDDDVIDPLLTETGHILLDALPVYHNSRVASHAFSKK